MRAPSGRTCLVPECRRETRRTVTVFLPFTLKSRTPSPARAHHTPARRPGDNKTVWVQGPERGAEVGEGPQARTPGRGE